jgi:hypothetical protein
MHLQFQVVLHLSVLCQVCHGFCQYQAMVLIPTDVADAVKCTTITLNGFTVPAGQGLTLNLATGTTVTMSEYLSISTGSPHDFLVDGDIFFGNASWTGPLFTVR